MGIQTCIIPASVTGNICSTFQADIDNSGTIDYGEFVAAMLHLNKIEKEDHMYAAFSYMDKDGSGYITLDELQQACEQFGLEPDNLEEAIHEADQDNVMHFLIKNVMLIFLSNIVLDHIFLSLPCFSSGWAD